MRKTKGQEECDLTIRLNIFYQHYSYFAYIYPVQCTVKLVVGFSPPGSVNEALKVLLSALIF